MALTPSTMLPLGTTAPDFTLLDTTSGTMKTLSELTSKVGTVVMFLCNHCPYVIHIQKALVMVAHEYAKKGISFIAISANDPLQYPQDGPDKMSECASTLQYPFPYLFDETQAVAKAYEAACTPDIYLFDEALRCVYRGRFDGSTPGNQKPVTGQDLKDALDHLLNKTPISPHQYPSIGCNIKWKSTDASHS